MKPIKQDEKKGGTSQRHRDTLKPKKHGGKGGTSRGHTERHKPKQHGGRGGTSQSHVEMPERDTMQRIMKEIELFSSSHATWKSRKELENKQVVLLGGKAVKQHRRPLSVAIPMMKNQTKREQQKREEEAILGRFSLVRSNDDSNKPVAKRKAEDRVLKSSQGCFRKGVLDVKHMLRPVRSKDPNNPDVRMVYNGKNNRGSSKRNHGKKKGARGLRHE